MSEPTPIKDEAQRQTVILVFSTIGTLVTVYRFMSCQTGCVQDIENAVSAEGKADRGTTGGMVAVPGIRCRNHVQPRAPVTWPGRTMLSADMYTPV